MAIGIDLNRKKIPDAQMSCHYCSGDSAGVDGRLNAPQGWLGVNTNSWLQVLNHSLHSFLNFSLLLFTVTDIQLKSKIHYVNFLNNSVFTKAVTYMYLIVLNMRQHPTCNTV